MRIFSDGKAQKIAEIILANCLRKLENVLAVGCGSGLEAAILARRLKANVVGMDMIANFGAEAAKWANLEVGNAMALRFNDSYFDLLYSYHALEHIDNPLLALRERKQVLKDGGGCWIGTPNKNRIIGYIGSKHATLRQKVRWNIVD